MSMLTIRRLDEQVKERLRVRAAEHGHSMEEEARRILRQACLPDEAATTGTFARLRRHFEPDITAELEPPERQPFREPPEFD